MEEEALGEDVHRFMQISLVVPVGNDKLYNVMGNVHTDEFRNYDPFVVKQIKHQTALRLESLSEIYLIDFSSSLLKCSGERVDKNLVSRLKSSDLPDEIDLLHDPWIKSLLSAVQGFSLYR